MSRHRSVTAFARIALAALVAISAGCANVAPTARGSSTNAGLPVDAASGGPTADGTAVVATADATGPDPAPARFGFPTAQPSTSLGSIVVTNPIAPRTLDLTVRQDDIWDRIRTGFGVPNLDSPLVAEQEAWFLAHPDYLRRAVERSSRYLFHVVEELNKRGMPTEIALLPFIESAYNPMAYSRANASGMWQFIPGTGKTYNLKQDWWHDERRDVVASTDAALTYLQTIYDMHGDWFLALASYNWGENAVKRAIDRNQAAGLPTDYLSLAMPDETRNYVPKLQAFKNIIANPAAFGVTLPRIDNEPYFVAVERSRDIDMRTAAKLANMTVEDFRALNPSYNRPVIPAASGTPLLVPADRARDFRSGLESNQPLATWQAHTVRRRETVEQVARQYGMTVAALREVNGLGARTSRLVPGQALLVQKQGPSDVNLQFASFVPARDAPFLEGGGGDGPGAYVVARGDSLQSIAQRFGTSTAALRAMNRLATGTVHVGERLRVPAAKGPVVASRHATAVRAGTPVRARSGAAVPTRANAPLAPARPAKAAATTRRPAAKNTRR